MGAFLFIYVLDYKSCNAQGMFFLLIIKKNILNIPIHSSFFICLLMEKTHLFGVLNMLLNMVFSKINSIIVIP